MLLLVKSHNRVKGTKVFACGFSGRNLKIFSESAGKSPCWGPFIVKLQDVLYCKVAGCLIIDYSVNLLKRRRLHGGSDTITFCKF